MTPAVTVCVPVFNAALFLAETLDSIAAQSFADIKVLISLDRGDDDSESICRRYLHDRRFELIVQRERLGWVGNVNALIERVDTPYFCITPHDDLPAPRYLAEVYALAASDPAIACAYSDVQGFGTSRPYFAQPDIRGTLLERVIDFLLNHFAVVPFRGIIRRRSSNDRPYIPTGLRRDYAADTVWMLHIALRGELRRVPSMLYAKRYHEASVHAPWRSWPREELIVLWAEQAATCARIALEHIGDSRDREVVLTAALMRVAGVGHSRVYATPKEPFEIAIATAIFCDALGHALALRDVQTILAYPNAGRLRDAIAANVSHDSPDVPAALASRIRRRLGNILRL
jgi:glycosyltransferase involved in cell wall biosynthesis